MSSTNNDSEDDDPRVHSSGTPSSFSGHQQQQPRERYQLSKSEIRKNNKPIMEKKRRARINQCLNELKTLILDALKKDPARHTKLEKADILEMTVRHLQSLHRNGDRPPPVEPSPSSSSPSTAAAAALTAAVVQKFQTGYQECAGEVNRFVGHLEGVDDDIKKRLTSHLDSCVAKMRYVAATASYAHDDYHPSRLLDLTAVVPLPGGDRQLPLPPPPPPSIVTGGLVRPSAFTAVHGPSPPYVYCDEPAVSSTSSWTEDVAAAAAAVKHPPLDFSMKKTAAAATTTTHGKRPLGDIPVNVPAAAAAAAASSLTRKPAGSDTPPVAQQQPCDDPDPNMWRPW